MRNEKGKGEVCTVPTAVWSPIRGGAIAAAALLTLTTGAAADTTPNGQSPQSLPGIDRVGFTDPMDRSFAASLSLEYGFIGSVLPNESRDRHHRAASGFGVSYRPLRELGFAIDYRSRFDKHTRLANDGGEGDDDGWIGEARVSARYVTVISDTLGAGAQLGLLIPPGGAPPSASADGLSGEGIAMLTYRAAPELRMAVNAGYRLDRSASSFPDADQLSDADRLSLGVSESSAVLAGFGATYDLGPVQLLFEGTLDWLVGTDAPKFSESPIRIAGGARYWANDSVQLQLLAYGSPSKAESLGPMEPLFPVESSWGASFAVTYAHPNPPPPRPLVTDIAGPAQKTVGSVSGIVLDEGGNPVADATVTITDAEQKTVVVNSDADGKYTAGDLAMGTATIRIESEGFKDIDSSANISEGTAAQVSSALVEALPIGQLRGVLQSFRGTKLVAEVTVKPGGETATSLLDGSFELNLAPGDYTITIRANGYIEQVRKVTIAKNGVTIMNVDLRTKK